MSRLVEIAKIILPVLFVLIVFGPLLCEDNAFIGETSYLDNFKDYDDDYQITFFTTLLCWCLTITWLGLRLFIIVLKCKPPSSDQETSREYAVTPFFYVRAGPDPSRRSVRFMRRENIRTTTEVYENGELIELRLENDHFIYLRKNDFFGAYWIRQIIILNEDDYYTTYSVLKYSGNLSGTGLDIHYRWRTVNHDDEDLDVDHFDDDVDHGRESGADSDGSRDSELFCGAFSRHGINDYYDDEFTICEDILDNIARNALVKPCSRLGQKGDLKGTLVALKSCLLEMLVWFILHDKLRIDLRLSSFKHGPIYTVNDIFNGTLADELQNELRSFIMKGHVVNHQRALQPPEISSKVSEERQIILEEQKVSHPVITRSSSRWNYCEIALGCGVAAIGLYAAYKYFRR